VASLSFKPTDGAHLVLGLRAGFAGDDVNPGWEMVRRIEFARLVFASVRRARARGRPQPAIFQEGLLGQIEPSRDGSSLTIGLPSSAMNQSLPLLLSIIIAMPALAAAENPTPVDQLPSIPQLPDPFLSPTARASRRGPTGKNAASRSRN